MRSRSEDNECRDCPIKEKSARISVGSLILRARALFNAETVAWIRDLDLDAAKTSSRLIFRVDRSLNGRLCSARWSISRLLASFESYDGTSRLSMKFVVKFRTFFAIAPHHTIDAESDRT